MKREFSFYEFVGIIVPSVTFLFFSDMLLGLAYGHHLIDFSTIGETVVFFIVAYGLGHVMHSLGNIYEKIIWKFFGGMPTNWLTKKPRFKKILFDNIQSEEIKEKLYAKFKEVAFKDYGKDAYVFLYTKDLTKRADIFSGNYSLFRGLAVSFLLVGIIAIKTLGWKYSLVSVSLCILATARMIRFAEHYAREVFRTFQNFD